ncbi:hypothetical protein E4U15_008108, partial [Claviceps sp. LM218 group G6]
CGRISAVTPVPPPSFLLPRPGALGHRRFPPHPAPPLSTGGIRQRRHSTGVRCPALHSPPGHASDGPTRWPIMPYRQEGPDGR